MVCFFPLSWPLLVLVTKRRKEEKKKRKLVFEGFKKIKV